MATAALHLSPHQIRDHHKRLILVEVGYCTDNKLAVKHQAKTEEHAALIQHIQHKGWTVSLYAIAVTHTGVITDTLTQLLSACQVTSASAQKTQRWISRHSCEQTNNLLITSHKLNASARKTASQTLATTSPHVQQEHPD